MGKIVDLLLFYCSLFTNSNAKPTQTNRIDTIIAIISGSILMSVADWG